MNTNIFKSKKSLLLCAGMALVGSQASALVPLDFSLMQDQAASSCAASSSSSSSSGNPVSKRQMMGNIKAIKTQTKDMPGFKSDVSVNIKRNIQKKERLNGSTYDFANFSISSTPAFCAANGIIAIGTDEPAAKEHFLVCISSQAMMDGLREDPVLAYLKVSEHMSDVKWVNETTLLAATGKGNFKLFRFAQQPDRLEYIGFMTDVSKSYIREMAIKMGEPSKVVYGGFDRELNFIDLNKPDQQIVQRVVLGDVIGSVKSAPLGNGAYVSCTLDEGKFYIFDKRTNIADSSFYFDAKKEDLFCHEYINDTSLLLGYGDGVIQHLDLRGGREVLKQTKADPYVEAISQIDIHPESNSILVTGYTDWTNYEVFGGEAVVQAHRVCGEAKLRGMGWACSGVHIGPHTVVTGSTDGTLSVTHLK